jgi:hypothetical protein
MATEEMRRLITLAESVLRVEGFIGTIRVLRNPSSAEFWNYLTRSAYKEVRGLWDGGKDFFIWDSYDDHHEQMAPELGLDIGLCSRLILGITSIGSGLPPRSDDQLITEEMNILKTCPFLQRLYAGKTVELYPYDPYDSSLQEKRIEHTY